MNFLINPRIVADIFENDLILANLDTGIYYSLNGLSVFLLSKLPFSEPEGEIQAIAKQFPQKHKEIIEDLTLIWKKLQKEEIIISTDKEIKTDSNFSIEIPSGFESSKLLKYADMQDLLMLDPIHEVSEDGWEVKEG